MEYAYIAADNGQGAYCFPELVSIHSLTLPGYYDEYWPRLDSTLSPQSFPALLRLQIEEDKVDEDSHSGHFMGHAVPWSSLVPQLTHLHVPIVSLTDLASQLARSTSLESINVAAAAQDYAGSNNPTATFIDGLSNNVNLHTLHYYERQWGGGNDEYWQGAMDRFEQIRDFISDSDDLKFLSLHVKGAGSRPAWIELKEEMRIICMEKEIKMVMLRSSQRGWGDDLTEDSDMVPVVSFNDLASQLAGSTSLKSINVAAEAQEYTELDDPTAMFIDGLRNNVNLHTLHYYERHDSFKSKEYWDAVIKRFKQMRDFISDSEELKLLSLRVEDAGRSPGWLELKKEIRIICERKEIEIVECRTFHRGSGDDLTDDSDDRFS
jgi:hypothetical protein